MKQRHNCVQPKIATSSPNTLPISSATLAATLVAATLLGCVHAMTWFSADHPASCRYCGNSKDITSADGLED
jgi:hypothetical protein